MFYTPVTKDGQSYDTQGTVLVDPATGAPVSDAAPLPVKISSAAGVTIEVNEADLANVGAKADAAAATDTGTYSIVALIKRALQNWTTLLAKIPALVSGRIPVEVAGNAAIGSAPVLNPVSIAGVDAGGLKRHILTETSGAQSVASGPRAVFTATIANGASLSGAVDLGNATAARLGTPATITVATNATLSFQTSHDGVTYKDLYDEYGNEYTIAAGKLAASRSYKLPLVDFASIRYLKVRTGTTGTPQVQAQSTDINITTVA